MGYKVTPTRPVTVCLALICKRPSEQANERVGGCDGGKGGGAE